MTLTSGTKLDTRTEKTPRKGVFSFYHDTSVVRFQRFSVLFGVKVYNVNMITICDSIEQALNDKNWYAALASALILPDICGSIDYPRARVGERYKKWFDLHLGRGYLINRTLNPTSPDYDEDLEKLQRTGHRLKRVSDSIYTETFLNGSDCYILRCKYLHQGINILKSQQAQNILNAIYMTIPPPVGEVHKQLITNNNRTVVQLQVDKFCQEIVDAARQWWDARGDKEELEDTFLHIHDPAALLSRL